MSKWTDLLQRVMPQTGTRLGLEDAICIEFTDWLRSQIKTGDIPCVFWHTANEGKRSWKQGTLRRAMGMVAGAPDYVILFAHGPLLLEFKTPDGRQSPAQKLFQKWCEYVGIPYHVVRSVREAQDLVEATAEKTVDATV